MSSLPAGNPPLCTYSTHYVDEANDVFKGNFSRVMDKYTLNGDNVLSANMIIDMVNSFATQRILPTFLFIGTRVETTLPSVQCFHLVTYFQQRMGM